MRKINLVKKKSIISVVTIITILAVLISSIYTHNMKVNAELREDQPSFDIEINATPNPIAVNEETTINGNIIPNEFTINVPEKDIVLVLDVSNSMIDKINGTNIAKLEKMNEAVIKFLDIVKDTPNMKVSIVAYSSDSFINPIEVNGTTSIWKKSSSQYKTILDYKCSTVNFFDANSENDKLKKIVETVVSNVGKIYYDGGYKYNGNSIEGGTSTGEALRQANRILNTKENVESKNKSIVLMTDGVPSYYSSNSNAKNDTNIENSFYMDINEKILRGNKNAQINDPPYLGGGGSITQDSVVENATGYAEKIGENIEKNNKNINIYTIGYGVGNNTGYILRIHESIAKDTKNLYFSSEDEGVEKAFTDIAYKISTKQESSNLVINLNLPENIQCKDGNTAINLGNDNTIKYTGEYINNNSQIKYTAEKLPFSFIIKGTKSGTYDLFGEENNSNINFSVIGQGISIKLPKVNLIVGIPNITAELNNKDDYLNSTYNLENEIPVSYTIKPEKFNYSGSDLDNDQKYDEKGPKDIVFVIDTSSKMKDKFQAISQALKNKIILNNYSNRFSIITYDSQYEYKTLDDYPDCIGNMVNNGINQYPEAFSNMLNKILDSKSNSNINVTECNLSGALQKACDILENGRNEKITENFDIGRGKAGKNIIIIGGNNVDLNNIETNSDLIKKIKQYNPITVDLGRIDAKIKMTDTNLKRSQYILKGKTIVSYETLEDEQINNYFMSIDYRKYDKSNPDYIFNDSNNFNNNNWIEDPVILRISGKLLGPAINSSNYKDTYEFKVKLKFNLNSNFQIISSLNPINDTTGYTAETNEITINYKLNNNGEYESNEQTVGFTIKPLHSGSLKFGRNNNIVYKGIEDIDLNNSIETPLINVKTINIVHGIYNGQTTINEYDNNNNFCNGAVIPMAAKFDCITLNQQIQIELKEGLNSVEKPKIYKIGNDNSLTLIESTVQFNNNKYVYVINELGKYIIVYNVKLNKQPNLTEEQFKSNFTISGISKPYTLKCIEGSSLPDLF